MFDQQQESINNNKPSSVRCCAACPAGVSVSSVPVTMISLLRSAFRMADELISELGGVSDAIEGQTMSPIVSDVLPDVPDMIELNIDESSDVVIICCCCCCCCCIARVDESTRIGCAVRT